jgi:hypothetical protein
MSPDELKALRTRAAAVNAPRRIHLGGLVALFLWDRDIEGCRTWFCRLTENEAAYVQYFAHAMPALMAMIQATPPSRA